MTNLDMTKTKKEHDEYTGRLIRIPLKPFVKFIIRYTTITPNQISIFSIIPGVLGIVFLAQGGYMNVLLGAVFSFLYLLLDATDGMVARIKNLKSPLGTWIDGILGYIFVPFMMLAVAFGLKNYLALLIGAVAAVCFPLQFTLVYYYKSEIKKKNDRIKIPIVSKYDSLRYIYGSALFFPLLLLGAIFDKVIYVLLFFAICGNLFWMLLLGAQFLSLKKQKQDDIK